MTSLPFFNGSGTWTVAHGQDYFADIVRSRNLRLDTKGLIQQSRKPVCLYTTDNDADFTNVLAIVADANDYYVLTDEDLFQFDLDGGSQSGVETTNAPTYALGSDAVFFAGEIWVSGTTMVNKYLPSADDWDATSITGLSSSYPHPLCVSEHQNYIAVGDGNVVRLYDSSGSTITSCTVPDDHIVTWIRWRESNLWFGTRNLYGKSAKMFKWNGSGTAAQAGYPINADWAYSAIVSQSSIVVLASSGELLRFNGGGFDHLAAFPVWYTPYSWSSSAATSSALGRCTNRGMDAVGDTIYINIDGSVDLVEREYPGPYLHDQPSGLWKYDPSVGLYHVAGYTYTRYRVETITGLNSNILTVGTAHNLTTGDAVHANSVSNITGITDGGLYFAIVDSSTGFYLARTPADALAGRHLTLTGTPSADSVLIDVHDSSGAVFNTEVGAVLAIGSDAPPIFKGTEVLYGGNVDDEDGNEKTSLMSLGRGRNVSSFTTTPLPAAGATDTFKKLYQRVQGLDYGVDKILLKVRNTTRFGLPTMPVSVTWTSTTSFTVNSAAEDVRGVENGDEVEVISGPGSGYTAHVSNIDTGSSTYTVTLDSEIAGVVATDVGSVIFDNWTLKDTIDSSNKDAVFDISESALGESGSWIQLKVELRGWHPSIRSTDINSVKARVKG